MVSIILVPGKEKVQCLKVEVENAIWSGIGGSYAAKRVERARLEGVLLFVVHGGRKRVFWGIEEWGELKGYKGIWVGVCGAEGCDAVEV